MTREELLARWQVRAAEAEQIGALAPVATLLRALMAEAEAVDGMPVSRPAPDTMLTLDEAAARLQVPKRWFTEHRDLPFLKRLSGVTVRVSEKELARWVASR